MALLILFYHRNNCFAFCMQVAVSYHKRETKLKYLVQISRYRLPSTANLVTFI